MSTSLEGASEALRSAKCVVALTGAGISVESGIPSFRGEDGIWVKYPPDEYASLDAYLNTPGKVWAFWCELAATVARCAPNPAHRALAALEELGRLNAIITQNIDNLHQDAGSSNVIEYHGNARWLTCRSCGHRQRLDHDQVGLLPPRCTCGEFYKPDVIMFGEAIPLDALHEAERLAKVCDVMLIVGTSAQVYPAAGLPFIAKDHGAFVIEANTESTYFTRSVTDAYLEGPAGVLLPELVSRVRAVA